MALSANALLTVEEARGWLDVQGADAALALEEEINRATEAIEAHCDRPLKKRTFTNVRVMGPHMPVLYLATAPVDIAQALTVAVNGTAQTVWEQESDGDPEDFDVLVGSTNPATPLGTRNHLFRHNAWCATSVKNPYNVLLTYTAGLDPIPEDLKEAALLLLQKLWRDRQKQLADVSTLNTPSGSVTILDRLPLMLRKTLDERYRRWTVA